MPRRSSGKVGIQKPRHPMRYLNSTTWHQGHGRLWPCSSLHLSAFLFHSCMLMLPLQSSRPTWSSHTFQAAFPVSSLHMLGSQGYHSAQWELTFLLLVFVFHCIEHSLTQIFVVFYKYWAESDLILLTYSLTVSAYEFDMLLKKFTRSLMYVLDLHWTIKLKGRLFLRVHCFASPTRPNIMLLRITSSQLSQLSTKSPE